MAVADDKKEMRKEAQVFRKNLSKDYRIKAHLAITDHGLSVFKHMASTVYDPVNRVQKRRVLGGYWPLEGEADSRGLMQDLERKGFDLALPVVPKSPGPLVYRQFSFGDKLVTGLYGVQHPPEEAPEIIPDIIIVPLLAFDSTCHRLGYGGGYYDRTIAAHPFLKTFGLAYAGQAKDIIPHEAHDVPLHGVITDVGLSVPRT